MEPASKRVRLLWVGPIFCTLTFLSSYDALQEPPLLQELPTGRV